MLDPISDFQSAVFGSPLSQSAFMLNQVTAAPYEGVWIPTQFLKAASIEIESTGFTSFSAQLYGTNLDSVGTVNQYNVAVGGTLTAGDTASINFLSPSLPAGSESVTYTAPELTETATIGGTATADDVCDIIFTGSTISGSPVTASYTVQADDTLTLIAAGLVAAITAASALGAAGITATNTGPVITISYPASTTTFTESVSGAETETITLAAGVLPTTTTIATALAAAINADAKLTALGIAATSSTSHVAITYPSIVPASLILSPSSPGIANELALSKTITGGDTETLTITAGSNGTALGSAITSLGLTLLSSYIPCRYLKLRLTALSATNITAALQGNA